MAIDISGVPQCDDCAHAAVCPNREAFIKFYEHRDQVMVKCGDGTGSLDTSGDSFNIRVEHRYLDGPGLEELYRELGLHGPGYFPCMSAFYGCPIGKWNYPFDSPIYAPYPRPAGYIPELCTGARNYQGERVPFIAPIAPPRTNEVHAAPYNYPTHWMSCSTCPNGTENGNIDYAKLGGTVYSTFATDLIQAAKGDVIAIDDIAIPNTIMGNYIRSSVNPVSFTVKSEEDVIIVFYSYSANSETEDEEYSTEEKLMADGLVNVVRFFHGKDLLFTNPVSKRPNYYEVAIGPVKAMIGRQSDDGAVKCPPDYYMPIKWNTEIGVPDISKAAASLSNYQQLILSDYRDLQLAFGDVVSLLVQTDKNWSIDIRSMQRQMNTATVSYVQTRSTTEQNTYLITFTMGTTDENFTIQLIREDIKFAPTSYPPIKYEFYPIDHLELGFKEVMAKDIKGNTMSVGQRVTLRTYSSKVLADSAGSYSEDAPGPDVIGQELISLVNYTINRNARFTFSEKLPQIPNSACVNPDTIRFGASGAAATPEMGNLYMALWKLEYDKVDQYFRDEILPIANGVEEGIDAAAISINPEQSLINIHPVMRGSMSYVYGDTSLSSILDRIQSDAVAHDLVYAFYDIPEDVKDFNLTNTFGADEEDDIDAFLPTATIVTESDSTGKPLSDYQIQNLTTLDADGRTTHNILVIVQPNHFYGFRKSDQNFCAYFIQVKETPRKTSLILKFDGSEMTLFCKDIDISKMKGYEMTNVMPEDLSDLGVEFDFEQKTAKLVGAKAVHYTLDTNMDITYQQIVTVNMHIPNFNGDESVQTESMAVLYRGTMDISFRNDTRYPIRSITVNGLTVFDRINVSDNGVEHNDVPRYLHITTEDFTADASAEDTNNIQSCLIGLYAVKTDLTIEVVYDTTIGQEVCNRCKDYVDTAPYTFMSWMPYCEDYQALN